MASAVPVALREPQPPVPVPLLPGGDDDVPLDLQKAFAHVYDLLGYGVSTDYSRQPETPLEPADAAWAGVRVRE